MKISEEKKLSEGEHVLLKLGGECPGGTYPGGIVTEGDIVRGENPSWILGM